MSKSALLRVQDVRDAYRLIGECRDLGADSGLWQPRMFEGLAHLMGGVACGGEGSRTRAKQVQVATVFDTFESGDREHFLAWVRDVGPNADPFHRALAAISGSFVTRTRRQLVSDAFWYRCTAFNEYRRKAHVDHQLASTRQRTPAGALTVLNIHRGLRERDFSDRERNLLHFFHDEIGRLIGRSLVSATEPTPDQLSRRLRQTLTCLLQGDSEKQVAARLGLSHATVHQYVTTLYRRFGVQSRAQLLAHAFSRMNQARWKSLLRTGGPSDGVAA